MNRLFAALAILALVGCAHSGSTQVPPASVGYQVNLSASVPVASGNWAGCTASAPCTYAFYAETIAGTTCDPTSNTNYHEITTPTARPSTPTFVDPNTTGLTKCYDVETVQGAANSAPSNVAGPIASPGIPLAPNLAPPVAQQAALVNPLTKPTQLAKRMAPMNLKAVASR